MDSYIKGSIQRLINESKILIVPENVTIEDALLQEDEHLLGEQNFTFEQPAATVISFLPEDDDVGFEQMYQFAKAKKLSRVVGPLMVLFICNACNR